MPETDIAPPRPQLALLCGLLCDAVVWRDVAAALGDVADVTIIAFPDHASIEAMAQTVLETMPGQFIVAGHSMGGRAALETLRIAPDRVEKLILLDTGIHATRAGEEESRGALVALARAQGTPALYEPWLLPMLGEDARQDPAILDDMRAMLARQTAASFAAQIRALLDRPETDTPLELACNIPTLLIVGREDRWSPVEQHEAIRDRLGDVPLVVIERAGHMAPCERPREVAAAIRDFLVEA